MSKNVRKPNQPTNQYQAPVIHRYQQWLQRFPRTIRPTLFRPTLNEGLWPAAKHKASQAQQATTGLISRFPFVSFLVFLALIVVVVVIGDRLRQPVPPAPEEAPKPKQVTTMSVGQTPELRVEGEVEKAGVFTIVAQTSGVVQSINFKEGDHVKRGKPLFRLSTNYQGANAASVSRQISQRSYQFVLDTYDTQKSLIQKNRDLANTSETQASELRAIARQSVDDTKGLISLNEEIVRGLDAQIADLELTNVGGINDAAILQIKANKAQILGALNGLRSGLRSTEYMHSDDQEPARLATLSKEVALQQLDIQEKSLDLNRDLAKLNVRLAQIGESLFYPGSPCSGTVERIHVKPGQVVNPGTVLATVTADDTATAIVALVPGELVSSLSQIDASKLYLPDQELTIVPTHIASEPTDNGLHAVTYNVEDETIEIPNQTRVEVGIPLRATFVTGDSVYLPLDALHFSQDESFVYIVAANPDNEGQLEARSQTVQVGEVIGQFVVIKSGIASEEQIILDRTVLAGDPVVTNQVSAQK